MVDLETIKGKRIQQTLRSVPSAEPARRANSKSSTPKDAPMSKQKEAQSDILVLDPERVAEHPEFKKALVRLAREQGLDQTRRFSELRVLSSFDSEITGLARDIVKQNKKQLEKTNWAGAVSPLNVFAPSKRDKERKLIETGIIQQALQEAARAIQKEQRGSKDLFDLKKLSEGEYKGVHFKQAPKLGAWEITLPEGYVVPGGVKNTDGRFVYTMENVRNQGEVERFIEERIIDGKWPHKEGAQKEDATAEEATKKLEDAINDEVQEKRKDAIDTLIKGIKDASGNPIDVTKIEGWDEKKFRELVNKRVDNPSNEKLKQELRQWGDTVWAHAENFALVQKDKENQDLRKIIDDLRKTIEELNDVKVRLDAIENKSTSAEAPIVTGIPPQVGRGAEQQYGAPQQPGQWVWQPAPQYQAPPASAPIFENNQSAPKQEAAAATQQPQSSKGTPDVIATPPGPTFKETTDAAKNPAQQAAEAVRAEVTGKVPKYVEQKLLEMEGQSAHTKWRTLRTIGLVGLTVAAGAATTMTFSAPLVAALGIKTAFATMPWLGTILTGAATGSITGGILGGVRGITESARATKNLAEGEKLYNQKGHVFRKLLRGAAFGAIGGGIGAGVMDAYGDQIRAGAGALGDWAGKEFTDLKNGAKDLLSGLWGADVVPLSDASAVSACTVNESGLGALEAKLGALSDRFDIRDGITRMKLNTLAGLIDQQNVALDAIKDSLNGVQTQNADLNNFVAQLGAEPKAGLTKLFNEYGNTAYYFFQNNIVLPDATPVAEVVPTPSVPEVTPTPDVASGTPDTVADVSAEAAKLVDQNILDTFKQAVTNGGIWTGTGNVLEAAGITPEMGSVGGTDILSYLTDMFEDYTQDGTTPGTKATSYFRQLGEGLLDKISNQTGATQITLKGDLNMEHLFGNEAIQKDTLRRISENPAMSADIKEKILPLLEKIFINAKVALSK